MRILLVHNRYRTRSGEDLAFDAEHQLLKSKGVTVSTFVADNLDVDDSAKISNALRSIWSAGSRRSLIREIEDFGPDVVHVHNTLSRLSPSVYYAADKLNVPVVQTLHNYRTICPNALLFRDGKECALCVQKKVKWPSIFHKCYRDSSLATGTIAAGLAVHDALGTWNHKIARYVALSNFAKSKFVEGGLPAERISVKPNFAPDQSGVFTQDVEKVGAVYVGRISEEKGVQTLLESWKHISYPLKIIGDGPLRQELEAQSSSHVRWLGRLEREETLGEIASSAFMVFPSECYENFPLTIAEAYSVGVPVVASNMGSAAEIVRHGQSGLCFTPRDPSALKDAAQTLIEAPDKISAMGAAARELYEQHYTPDQNFLELTSIYEAVIEQSPASEVTSLAN